jgi:hypothetical protein
MMALRIRDYFKSLGLDEDKARELHQKYYREYGLAIRGLVKHHDIGASRARDRRLALGARSGVAKSSEMHTSRSDLCALRLPDRRARL